ncbi:MULTISPECIES: hypothetical protein [Trichocoleus]|uniref:Uncharacterized protein n=1 Tax=Trichocoleus desertorum GB2-A4 TaxID=2933944 RepID=A0ABV0JH16_9CYAN|nr:MULTISPECIES: hypothetical protein [unclassified Trichocoleus]MBD1860084.1 hypothetical protein [Trichocoleus sp. FACHB-46]MBD2096123.1 hypothetical protein [Trichocoleus sp. FACHB-591]MBD2124217.1 hypothetical protein [Trichocoleus sp. FACHB-262]
MEDDLEELLAQQAQTIAKLKKISGQIRSLLSLFQDLKQEQELQHPLCGCCGEK